MCSSVAGCDQQLEDILTRQIAVSKDNFVVFRKRRAINFRALCGVLFEISEQKIIECALIIKRPKLYTIIEIRWSSASPRKHD